MNADGTAIRRLTQHPADDSEPVWSPAGAASMGGRGRLQIAFVSERDGNKEIYILDLDEASQTLANHGLHRLTHNSADDYSPTWSPDGTQIAFVSERHGNPEIYVLNVAEAVQDPEGVAVRRLTRNNARERDPDWAPAGAGEQIAFASDRDGNWEIYAKSPGGGGESATRRLTHREENDTDPAWSPDGTSIAFSSSDKNSIRIYVMNSEGDGQGSTEPKQLTSNQEQAFDPVWSPDGDRILYSLHNVERDPGLYIVNRDGSQQRYLSEAWGGYYQDWRTYPQGPVAGEPPLKPGPVVDAPRADTPRIDGTLNAEEWAEAYRVEIDASRELLLMHDGAYWYLGIRSPDVGLGSLCVDRGSQVAILHASAALGTALYDLAGGSWQPVQDFSWRCRSTSDSSYAQQEREEFLAENDWLGTNVNLGTAGELEYQIAVDGESVRLAVSYLAQADEDRVIQWPTGLDDDCGRLRLVQGYTPENLRFLPETWVTVRAAP